MSTSARSALRHIEVFRYLDDAALQEFEAKLRVISITRGSILIRQGDDTGELYIVLSGRFQVLHSSHPTPVAEIGVGEPIGEVAFFTGSRRTATVKAARDSVVVVLTRYDFEQVAKRSPGIWRTVAAELANRLAERNVVATHGRGPIPKTLTLCAAGPHTLPETFLRHLQTVFSARSRCIFVTSSSLRALCPTASSVGDLEVTTVLNRLEEQYDYVVYVADADLTTWTEKAIRQADLVLWVAQCDISADLDSTEMNTIERFSANLSDLGDQRLVLLHSKRGGASGTRRWLHGRPTITMHHHVTIEHIPDYERLFRFTNGTALGLVACGGGAFCAAHIGFYQALLEAGLEFDIMGGTSGGAALTAAFALGVGIEDISHLVEEIFVVRRAMGRWTWPRYSLLEHTALDAALLEHYTSVDIEDLWTLFFAVSTNLSRSELHYHRTGPLWEAVRASSSIPALLPPVYTKEGELLVDGCLLDNLPIKGMRALKSGPNVVIDFDVPTLQRFDVDYAMLPSRGTLLLNLVNPFRRSTLPSAPSPASILMRSLMVNRQNTNQLLTSDDLLMVLRIPEGIGHLDWQNHRRLRQIGYDYAVAELNRARAEGHAIFEGTR